MEKVKEGYKITEFGEIPIEWEVVSTEDIVIGSKGSIKIGPFGSQLKKEILVDKGYKVYGQENVFSRNYILGNRYLTNEKFEELKSCELKSGDFVISMMGTIGKCDIVPKNIKTGIMDSHLLRLRINDNEFNKNLLKQLIGESDIVKKQIKKLSVGGIMDGLSSTIVKQLKYPKPNMKEQQEILLILSSVDEQIENTDNLIEKTKELKKGLMQRLLTKGIRHERFKHTEIGRIPEEWEVRKFKEIFKVSSGNFLSQKNVVQGEYPVYGGNGITSYHNEYLFEDSKIVIGRVGAKCGCVCVSQPKSWITDNALFISDKIVEFEDDYMFYLLNYMNLNQYANQNAQPVISGQKIYELNVALPSKNEQETISNVLLSVDEIINQYKSKKDKLQELKKGLMQKLLTGKVRVKI